MKAPDGRANPFSYWGRTPPPRTLCPGCRSPIDFKAVSHNVRVRGQLDVYRANLHMIVSQRFREFCDRSGYSDVDFPLVDGKRGLYELRPTRVLEVDIERSEPILKRFCTTCGNFTDYGRGRGVFFYDITDPLSDGIYRTDLLVGCGRDKWYDVVVAPVTRQRILDSGFRRIEFRALPDIDPNFDEYKEWSKGTRKRLADTAREYAEERRRMVAAGEIEEDPPWIIYPKSWPRDTSKSGNGNGKRGRSDRKTRDRGRGSGKRSH